MRLSDINPVAWIVENRIRVSSGEPFDFKQHFFWYDILTDMSPKQVFLKAAQGGGTEMMVLKAIYLCDRRKMDIIYTVPTAADVNTTVGARINKLITLNPSLARLIKDKDSVEMKAIGDKTLYVRGTWTERAAISVPADVLIHDEEDRSNQPVLKTYSSRLQHSKYKWDWHFSNPSFRNVGVDSYWQKSDQKHWFIKCPSCEIEQFLSWPDSIDLQGKRFVCKVCKGTLSNDDRRRGRWVKKREQAEYSGYWVSALMYPWIDAAYLIREFETKPKEYFYNFVLGLPYEGDGDSITPDIIFRNCTDQINDQEGVVIGVDIGNTIHYVLGNKKGLFHYGKTEDPEDIERLLRRFRGSVAVVDNGPDIFWPKKLREKFRGRVFLCSFSRVKRADQLIRWGENEEEGRVLADRNRTLQMVVDEFADQRIPLQGTQDDWAEYYAHWHGMGRVKEIDAIGNPVYVWTKADGNDHWCFRAGTMIETESGPTPIESVELGDRVLTREGWKPVIRNGLVDENAEVIESVFSDGSSFVSTPDHEVWVTNRGFVPAQAMVYGDQVISLCQANPSSSTESNSGVTHSQKTEQKGFITSPIQDTEGRGSDDFTKRSTRLFTERYRKVFAFITKMKTLLTMILRTLSFSYAQITSANTTLSVLKTQRQGGKTLNTSAQSSLQEKLTNGTRPKKGASTVGTTLNTSTGKKGKRSSPAPFANRSTEPGIQARTSTAESGVKLKQTDSETPTTFVSTRRIAEREKVYNLTVADCHEYFANGILVANCLATNYWRIGMDRFGGGQASFYNSEHGQRPDIQVAPKVEPDGTMANPMAVRKTVKSEVFW